MSAEELDIKNKYYHICSPVRTIIFLCIFLTPEKFMNYWLLPVILTLFGAIYRYATYNDTQKGTFNQPVHWQNMRLFHIIIIIIFIVSIICKQYSIAKILPAIDCIVSLLYMNNRYKTLNI